MSGIMTGVAAAIAFVATAIVGKWAVPFLHKLHFGQTIKEIGPTWHKNKQGTPTMGGMMFIIGIVCAIIIAVPIYYSNVGYAPIEGLEGISGETGLQRVCLFKKRNLGLRARQKILLQLIIACAYLASLYLAGERGSTVIPFAGTVNLGWFYWPAALFVILGTVNAVNLTDGIDGLAGSVTMFACIFFMIVASLLQSFGMSIFAAAAAGGCLGFLLYNFHPAKVFMGDTGSLFLGGVVAALGFGVGMPVLILPIGIVYFMEAMSDIIQIGYFKVSHGKRVFKMAPIHHHFEMSGWSEVKIVTVFSLITIVGGAAALLCVIYG